MKSNIDNLMCTSKAFVRFQNNFIVNNLANDQFTK